MRLSTFLVLVLSLLGMAAPAQQLTIQDGGELTLRENSETELSGTFRRGDVSLRFASIRENERGSFELFDGGNRSLLRVEADARQYTIWLFGDRVASGRRDNGDGPADHLELRGSEEEITRRLDALVARPEYRVLPNLAIELVHLRIGGGRNRGASFVHGIALASARQQELAMPNIAAPPSENRAQLVVNAVECTDLRPDPCPNESYGMCGDGRNCWLPVCDTCCGYEGCYTHDLSCRAMICKPTLGNRLGCVTFATFFRAKQACRTFEGCRKLPCD